MPAIDVHGVRHYYRLEGATDRPALVLVHALGTDHSLWDAVVAELPLYRVLRYDLRGHGGSATPPGETNVAQLARDLLALASALGLERFALAGVSLGALVALQAAVAAPERVQCMVLASATARIPGPPNGGWPGRAQQALAGGMDALAPAMLARMFAPDWLARGEPPAGALEHVFRGTDPAGYAAGCAALRDADLEGLLPRVAAPALVVRGARDALIPEADARRLARGLPRGAFASLDGGHYPMVEAPEAFAQALLDWVEGAGGIAAPGSWGRCANPAYE